MINALLAILVFSSLFILLLCSVYIGRYYGRRQLAHHALKQPEVVTVAEGAVFALLGLLIAFTFSGAYERFEARKMQIIDEANAIETAYSRLDLLAPQTQPALRKSFRQYVDSRLATTKKLPDIRAAYNEWQYSRELKNHIWNQAIAACKLTNNSSTTELLIPALNNMFDTANALVASVYVHSPIMIFLLLITLAVISTFLAGYSTVKNKIPHSIYIFLYVVITAMTIYIILDLEFPLVGLIRVTSFEYTMIEARHSLG